jgi:hypothetical protein
LDRLERLLYLGLDLKEIGCRGRALGIYDYVERQGQVAEADANRFPHAPLQAVALDGPA